MALYWERDAKGRTSVKKTKPKPKPVSQLSGPAVVVPDCRFPDLRKPKTSSPPPYYKKMPNYTDYAHYHDENLDRYFAGFQLGPAGQPVMMEGGRFRNLMPHDQNHDRTQHIKHTIYTSHQIDSLAVNSGTQLYPPHRHTHIDHEPSLPFATAAQQLDRTIRQTLIFFENFHTSFRESTDDLKVHASSELLNKIWQSQISASSNSALDEQYNKNIRRNRYPGIPQSYFQQPFMHQHHMYAKKMPHNYDSEARRHQPAGDLLSFKEYRSLVLSRIEAFLRSKMPSLPATAAHCFPSSPLTYRHDHAEHIDEEVFEAKARHRAAQSLVRKIHNSYKDLYEAMEGMGRDHICAKQAIQKIKIVRGHLDTYRQAWDPRGAEKEEWNRDEEMERGRGVGDRGCWMDEGLRRY